MLLTQSLKKNTEKNAWLSVKEQNQIDISTSSTTDKYITSHFEGYVTKDSQHRYEIKSGKTPSQNNNCRLCNYCVEDITHVISSYSKLSSGYYLPLKHDIIAKAVHNKILRKKKPR